MTHPENPFQLKCQFKHLLFYKSLAGSVTHIVLSLCDLIDLLLYGYSRCEGSVFVSLPNHITYKPLFGPMALFLHPIRCTPSCSCCFWPIFSPPLSLSLSHGWPIQGINTTPHPTISPSATCGAVSKATTFDVTSGGIGWMGLRGSEAFIRVGHSSRGGTFSLSPPFSCPSHLFSLIYLFAPALNVCHSFPPFWFLGSETLRATLKRLFDALLKLSDRGCLDCEETWKCEIEDGPARDVVARVR